MREKYKPELNTPEILKGEVIGLSENVTSVRNVLSILKTSGLSALKLVLRK